MIEITVPDSIAEAYVARPDEDEHPGVLFFADAIGLRPRIEQMADRIASWGYVVLAPNVFHRYGRAADLAPTTDLRVAENRAAFIGLVMPRVRALTSDLAVADIAAYVAALRGLPGVSGSGLGAVGYCMGAGLSVRAATGHPGDVVACGGFHGGRLVTEAPDSPHRGLGSARAEFVFGHADNDASMPPEAVAELGEALTAAGLSATNEVYAGAAHGYSMADTASYDEAATERHFTELQALFARTL
jgi:carboxymethylenebutenolidase